MIEKPKWRIEYMVKIKIDRLSKILFCALLICAAYRDISSAAPILLDKVAAVIDKEVITW
ncbi:hypothetical protein MCHI_000531, partial [Candidatus Magnetoovum chiemensis]